MNSSRILLASTIALAVVLAGTLGMLYLSPGVAVQVFNLPSSQATTFSTPSTTSLPSQSTYAGTTSAYPTEPIQLSDNTLSLSGFGVVSVNPDRAKIQMTISIEASTAQEAAAKNADTFAKFIQALEQAGINRENVSTTQYNIYPVYNYPSQGGQPVLTGYRADQSFVVTVVSDEVNQLGKKAGQVIDVSVAAGVNQVSSIYFTVSDSAIKTLQNQALVGALNDAAGQAKLIADTLGLKIVAVKSVSYGSYYPLPVQTTIKESVSSGPAATEVIPGSLQVSATVQVVYLIAQA
jgi:uncharacterized protein YggE